MKAGGIVSDAPLVSEVVLEAERGPVLRRRLDPAFRSHSRARALFLAEVEAAARPGPGGEGLARVFVTETGPEPILEREFRFEGTLRSLIEAGVPVPARQVLAVVSGLARALDSLHRLGLAHGDPCPENVLLRAEGGVVLADARSSRRAFVRRQAEEGLPVAMALDRARIPPIARRLLDLGGGDPSPLRAELIAIAECGWETERTIAAFLTHAAREPVSMVASPAPPVVPDPRPVPVVVTVSPIRDKRVRHTVARICSAASRMTPGMASRTLELGTLSIPSTFPAPSRSLAEALRTAGATVTVSLPGRGSEAVPARER